ncbi:MULTISPECIES: 4-hydroxy-tetrahydrodipicolinate reductase [Candidatus Ichthyocystis]|uniref:4-hydroxy-tetrahydrodipicolinate reductase n=1 Tax=Candidatus Ichthyocystis hellenicum TaxID=1561003 RepID=A0A0S4M2P3_9BURK|nr:MULTISPECIES: 4-hydroxy-tetrahydrodipicolinate reductase [Ichthyocystis]CUT18041.1 Dihydrodipicolinate reductase [Candidatus Ichthyocystis hellenicum]
MRVAISSCRGRMSRLLIESVIGSDGLELACVFSRDNSSSIGKSVSEFANCQLPIKVSSLSVDALSDVDVLIDFSHPEWTEFILPFCSDSNTKLVIGTTGIADNVMRKISDFSRNTACVFSANMSVGMNLMYRLLRQSLIALGADFDLNMSDSHHCHKKDSPSGTMKRILSIVSEVEEKNAISFEKDLLVTRLGDIVGEHKVIFSNLDECLEIRHTAHSRKIFTAGATKAALFLDNHEFGLFDMDDVLG